MIRYPEEVMEDYWEYLCHAEEVRRKLREEERGKEKEKADERS